MKHFNKIKIDSIERKRIGEMLKYEHEHWIKGIKYISGIDEAGRGPLAGPVVAAAVIFSDDVVIHGVNDSKKLSSSQRERLYNLIYNDALAVGIGICDERLIDEINILQATYQAMKKAIVSLPLQPQHILVDGKMIPDLQIPQTALIQGDQKCFSIAAASIIAKVTRDRIMVKYDSRFPQYGFAQHKGYPTQKHINAIIKHGICSIHRTSFKIKNINSYE